MPYELDRCSLIQTRKALRAVWTCRNLIDDLPSLHATLLQRRCFPVLAGEGETLVVPYQCLLGWTTSTVDTLPSPAAVLPPSLISLKVDCPQIHLYDWIARLEIVHDRFLLLADIELYCQSPHGDEWPEFKFGNSDHRALHTLNDFGIYLYLTFCEQNWRSRWRDYDLEIFDVIDWLESFGEKIVAECSWDCSLIPEQ